MGVANVHNEGGEQIIEFPKDFQLENKEYFIEKVGNVIVLTPKDDEWATFWAGAKLMSDDFMEDGRNQPVIGG